MSVFKSPFSLFFVGTLALSSILGCGTGEEFQDGGTAPAPTTLTPEGPIDEPVEKPCTGTFVGRVRGQVLDTHGNAPTARIFTICGNACLRGDMEEDGTFDVQVDFCYAKREPLIRPVFIYHGTELYADLYVDFIAQEASEVLDHRFATPLVTVATEEMTQVEVEQDVAGILDDGAGFSLTFPAGSIVPAYLSDAIGAVALETEHFPRGAAEAGALAFYATWPEGTSFDVAARVAFPNSQGLAPGSEVEILALGNLQTGVPYAGVVGPIASGQVSADGLRIESNEEEGLRTLTWVGYRIK